MSEGNNMAIKHTAVSYYGINYVEHAEKDFQEMLDHGCDTVILALTEFDMDFWFPNINAIIKKAHEMGLRVLADTWGIGKYFGGEQVSLFLQNNIHHRQVSAYTGEVLNAACFNTNSFRDYFTGLCMKLARETEVDGFFWDEPHYAYPKAYASITGGAGDDWACRCPECMKKFEDYYGYEMPKFMNDDVKQFRWREALKTLYQLKTGLSVAIQRIALFLTMFPALVDMRGIRTIFRHHVPLQPVRFAKSSMPKQNFSHRVNVINDGSPSRIRIVRRISLGMTTRPKSS